MNTLIIGNVHRKPLALDKFEYLKPIVSLTPDYPFPAIGHFRCFHGHTNALKCCMTDESALVMEDDCIPDEQHPWKQCIEAAREIVFDTGFEFACLHGRGFDFSKFRKFRRHSLDWLLPITNHPWVLGTLCYVVNRQGARKFCAADFWLGPGNIDLFLWSDRHSFCLLDPRQFATDETLSETRIAENPPPFIHGCGAEQSVLQNPRNTEQVYI